MTVAEAGGPRLSAQMKEAPFGAPFMLDGYDPYWHKWYVANATTV